MVDKRTCASGAGTVHTLVDTAVEKYNFCVLSAELYNGGGIGLQLFNNLARGINLLRKRQTRTLGKTETCGAGNGNRRFFSLPDIFFNLL